MRGTLRFEVLLVFVAALCLAAVAFADEMAGELDGSSFEVQVTGGDDSWSDTLLFANGTFDSVECRQYGFGAVQYDVEKKGDSWTFSAEASSEKEGVTHWKGTVSGNSISGTMEWTKPGQDPVVYEFSGASKS